MSFRGFGMYIRYGFDIEVELFQPTTLVTMMDVHSSRSTDVLQQSRFQTVDAVSVETLRGAYGNVIRRLTAGPGTIPLRLNGVIADNGMEDEIAPAAPAVPLSELPAETLPFLMASRYCETDLLSNFAWSRFGGIEGGWAKVQAVCDFVHDRLAFSYPNARETRTAAQALEEGSGVCRDFTHLAVTQCRCLNIPARFCNGYLGDIGVPPDPAPMDFNAWFEAYVGGRWYTFDARHNQPRIGRILISRGRDAADVAMITSFGPHRLRKFEIIKEEAPENASLAA